MNDRVDVFLDRMCSRIKYKTIHKELKNEVREHIEETAEEYESFGYEHDNAYGIAVSHMGNAFETGDEFNKFYRLPFDSRFGLGIWAAIVTVIIYLAYPLMHKINNFTLMIKNGPVMLTISIVLFAVINVMFLRRSRLKLSVRDIRDISVGFLIGAAVTVSALFIASSFGKCGYYPYFNDVKILFFNKIIYYGGEMRTLGNEFLILFFCIVIYALSIISRDKSKPFTLVAGWFRISDGMPMEDANVLIEGKEKDGRKIRMVELAIMGLRRDKYGDEQKGMKGDNF